jgi:hypothetical protein
MKNISSPLDMLNNLFLSLLKGNINAEQALEVRDLYGDLGMVYSFQIGPYLCILPPVVTVVMFIVFKRRKLLGVTQKFILAIMVIDLCYTAISALREGLLRFSHMHYGFLEYRVCSEVIVAFRVQTVLHTISLWMKSLMSIHHALLVGMPMKFRLWNLRAAFLIFLATLAIIITGYILLVSTPNFKPIPLVQEFKEGFPMRRIVGCSLVSSGVFGSYQITFSSLFLTFFTVVYSQVLPLVLHCVCTGVLTFLLVRHVRSLSVLTNGTSSPVSKIKYITLLKVNIALGISFLLQELPNIVNYFLQIDAGMRKDIGAEVSQYQGISMTVMSISFSVGKPIDLLIYASLSKSFMEEIKHIFCCKRKRGK